MAIAQTQEAWKRGCVTGALLVDVAAAFPSVARECLPRKVRSRGLGEGLVKWTNSSMRNRRAIVGVDGQDSDPMGCDDWPPLRTPNLASVFRYLHCGYPPGGRKPDRRQPMYLLLDASPGLWKVPIRMMWSTS